VPLIDLQCDSIVFSVFIVLAKKVPVIIHIERCTFLSFSIARKKDLLILMTFQIAFRMTQRPYVIKFTSFV
jgi:hypothetical protein